ncbi:hypothetical protein HOY80DRAFT_385697 [Tuber brumale]|nr:hypothetical protein HOY80DRAFT_385697 [Tuber brumale]
MGWDGMWKRVQSTFQPFLFQKTKRCAARMVRQGMARHGKARERRLLLWSLMSQPNWRIPFSVRYVLFCAISYAPVIGGGGGGFLELLPVWIRALGGESGPWWISTKPRDPANFIPIRTQFPQYCTVEYEYSIHPRRPHRRAKQPLPHRAHKGETKKQNKNPL